MIDKNSAILEDRELVPYYVAFLKSTMEISRNYQNDRRKDG